MEEEVKYPSYRWVMLFLAWLIGVLITVNHVIVATKGKELIPQLGLSATEYYLCYTAVSVAPIVLCLAGGMLTDRFGVKWVLGIGSIIATVGALLRLVSTGFIDFFLYMALIGVGWGVVMPIRTKLVGAWFPPNQVAIATAIYLSSALGVAVGLIIGPMFPTWQSGVLWLSLALAVFTVLWFIMARERTGEIGGVKIIGVPFKEGLAVALKSKNMWWIAISYFLAIGVEATWMGGLPHFLQETKEMSAKASSLIPALAVFGYLIGSFFWAVLGEKIGKVKQMYMFGVFMTGWTGFVVYLLAPGPWAFILGIFPGFFVAAAPTFAMQAPIHLPEFGPRYAGNAAGLLMSVFNISGFAFLPFIFTPVWVSYGPFWAILVLPITLTIAAILFIPVIDFGRVAREARGQAAQQKPS